MKKRPGASAPADLLKLQEEFGKSIRTPFDFSTGRFAFQKDLFSSEAVAALVPRGALAERDRLSVYNEQYWFRLLTAMQEDFPLLCAAVTLWEFNQLATAYLDRHPSTFPYLDHLPDHFPAFIRGALRWSSPRNVQIVDLEYAFLKAFHAPSKEPLDPSMLASEHLDATTGNPLPVFLSLQPHFFLVEEDWNLMECRNLCIGQKDTATPDFREQKGYWAVFRNGGVVETRRLDPLRFALLGYLVSGQSLEDACGATAEALEPAELAVFAESVSGWFAEWTALRWFQKP